MSVYFAAAGPYIKIGYSADPIARASTVTTAGKRPATLPRATPTHLIGWIPGDRAVEAAMHQRFAADHVAGEWFYISADMVRDLIWADPRGVDMRRMSAMAVFTAQARPEATREQMELAGIPVEAKPFNPDTFWSVA